MGFSQSQLLPFSDFFVRRADYFLRGFVARNIGSGHETFSAVTSKETEFSLVGAPCCFKSAGLAAIGGLECLPCANKGRVSWPPSPVRSFLFSQGQASAEGFFLLTCGVSSMDSLLLMMCYELRLLHFCHILSSTKTM